MTAPMIRRQAAAQAVCDAYVGQLLDYRQRDCGRMAAMSLKLLGWKPRWSRFTGYSSELGARRKLLNAGFKDLPPVLDDLGLPKISALRALPGDILGLPGEGDWTALGVAMGNGNFLCAGSDLVFRIGGLAPAVMEQVTAWQAEPRGEG